MTKAIKRDECQEQNSVRRKLWRITNDPTSSKTARLYTVLTNLVLFCWLTLFVYQTLPDVRQHLTEKETSNGQPDTNATTTATATATTTGSYLLISPDGLSTVFLVLDTVFFAYFLVDATLRFVIRQSA
jgi:hypothetical protein